MSEDITQKPVISAPEVSSEKAETVPVSDTPEVKSETKDSESKQDVKSQPKPTIDTDAMVAGIAKRRAEKLAAKQTAEFKAQIDSLQNELKALKSERESQSTASFSNTSSGRILKHPETGQDLDGNLTVDEFLTLEQQRAAGNQVSYVKQTRQAANFQPNSPSKNPETVSQSPTHQISDDFMAQAEWCAANIKGERQGDDFNSVMKNHVTKVVDIDMLNAAACASRNGALDIYELGRTAEGFKKLAEIASIDNPERKKFAMYELIKARDAQRESLYASSATPQPEPLSEGGKLNNYFTETGLESLRRRRGY